MCVELPKLVLMCLRSHRDHRLDVCAWSAHGSPGLHEASESDASQHECKDWCLQFGSKELAQASLVLFRLEILVCEASLMARLISSNCNSKYDGALHIDCEVIATVDHEVPEHAEKMPTLLLSPKIETATFSSCAITAQAHPAPVAGAQGFYNKGITWHV